MNLQRIDNLDRFETLAPEWAGVTRESSQHSPFLSHDWFRCCWRACSTLRRPEVLLVEDSAGPVGFVPLVRWKGTMHRVPVRFVGMLDAPDTPFTDWLTVGPPERVVEAVLTDLARRRDWDVLALSGLPTGSPTVKALEAYLPRRFRWHRLEPIRSPYVDVSRTWDEFWTAKSQRFKKTVRSVRNRLLKAGTVRVEEHRNARAGSAILQEVIAVSGRSWKAGRGVAIANMPHMPEFFQELSERASLNGWLRLWILRLDGRAVATEYQLEADGQVYALRADFDASVPTDLSPGTHLSGEILHALFERDGVHEYNMGPGENAYKQRWASDTHETTRLLIFRPGVFGAALHSFETRAIPALRRLRGIDDASR